jgi:hypothetical protein
MKKGLVYLFSFLFYLNNRFGWRRIRNTYPLFLLSIYRNSLSGKRIPAWSNCIKSGWKTCPHLYGVRFTESESERARQKRARVCACARARAHACLCLFAAVVWTVAFVVLSSFVVRVHRLFLVCNTSLRSQCASAQQWSDRKFGAACLLACLDSLSQRPKFGGDSGGNLVCQFIFKAPFLSW